MSEKSDRKEIFLKLASPVLFLGVAWLVVILITVGAVVVSVEGNCWQPLAKSGSLIVVVALLLALLDFSGWARNLLNFALSVSSKDGKAQLLEAFENKITNDLNKHGVKKSKEEIAFMAEREMDVYNTYFPDRFGSVAKGMFVGHEIAMATYGTILSGFGEAIGGVLIRYTC